MRPTRPSPAVLAMKLRAHGGNITQLASELKVSRPTVYRWITQLGLAPLAGLSNRYSSSRNAGCPADTEAEDVTPVVARTPIFPSMEALSDDPRVDTTVNLPRRLWKNTRKRAIDEDVAAHVIVQRALERYLSLPPATGRPPCGEGE